MYDVLVIGAGPAGSSAAVNLVDRGLSVLVVDKAVFPRDKTCGDMLGPRALVALKRMGAFGEAVKRGHVVNSFRITSPTGRTTRESIPGDWPRGLVVRRRALDDVLIRHAVGRGAHFQDGLRVERIEQDEHGVRGQVALATGKSTTIQARAAVVATGASTVLLDSIGLGRPRTRLMLARRAYLEGATNNIHDELHLTFDGTVLPGYGWLFPLSPTLFNVGICYHPGPRSLGSSQEPFARFIREANACQAIVRSTLERGEGYPIRVDFLRARTVANRVLVVGEAAGLVNPLTGEGIAYALESGEMAAQRLAHCMSTGDVSPQSLLPYETGLRRRFQRLFRFCLRLNDWVVSPRLLDVMIGLANHEPRLRHKLTTVVLGL